jgi:hypothetical protein
MMKHLLIFFFFILANATAQTLSRSVNGSAGGEYTTGTGKISFSIGEPVVSTLTSPTTSLLQGFQQPVYTIFLINLKAFIEGFYKSAGLMNPILDPVTRPLDCDTVILQLANINSPYSVIQSDTSILSTTGNAQFTFSGDFLSKYFYLVIRHRNSLETWSQPVRFLNSAIGYDFSSAAANAYGNNQHSVGGGNYAILSGDVNQDGQIDQTDLLLVETAATGFFSGYYSQDITGDNIVEAMDYSFLENMLGLIRLRP